MKKEPLSYKLLLFIGFILKETKFTWSYQTLQQTLYHLDNLEYKISTLRKEFSNLKRDGLIELKTYYHKPIPILSPRGKLAIKTNLPFKSYGAWDEIWRVIIFDIPETDRKYRWALRDKLTRLGFGKLQKSAYISPYPLLSPVNRFSSEMGIRQYLRFMEISKIDDEKKLVEKTWNLEKINEDYQQFLRKTKNIRKDKFWPYQAKKLELEFVEIYENDPHLPNKFLPKNWSGQESYKIFKEISNSY